MEKNRTYSMNEVTHRIGAIAARDLGALAAYRHLTEWKLRAKSNDIYWLKVAASDEEIFRKLPLLGRWVADADGQLTREGKRVPEAMLPLDGWQALASLLPINPPLSSTPGMPPPAIDFRLEEDDAGHLAMGLLCRFDDFAAWADTAFAARVEILRFACCEDGRAMVMGTPLPPLPGAGFHRHGRLWLPCGWRLPDFVWPELVEEVLGLGRNRMSIIHPDGSHEDLDEENVIAANRPTIRFTKNA